MKLREERRRHRQHSSSSSSPSASCRRRQHCLRQHQHDGMMFEEDGRWNTTSCRRLSSTASKNKGTSDRVRHAFHGRRSTHFRRRDHHGED